MGFFGLDSPFYKVGSEIADAFILLFYWFIGCIPIVTIGASTTAFYYVVGKKVRKEDTYVTKDFFKSFKLNFKQSIPLTLVFLVLWISSIIYYNIAREIVERGNATGIERYIPMIALIFIVEVVILSIYVFAVLSRFNMKTKNIFITSFVLAHRHILTTFAMLGGIYIAWLVVTMVPILMIAFPIIVVFLTSFFLQGIFKKYIEKSEEENSTETDHNIEEVLENEEETQDILENK